MADSKIIFTSALGTGDSVEVEIASNQTVEAFLQSQGLDAAGVGITLIHGGQRITITQSNASRTILRGGDEVRVTPKNVTGA